MEIIVSLIIAISQSILLYGKQLGISIIIFMLISIGSILAILYKRGKIVNLKATLLIIPIILLSSTYMIFANKTFYTINIIVIIVLTAIMFIMATVNKKYISGYLCALPKLIYKILDNLNNSMKLTSRVRKEKIRINSKISVSKIIGSIFIVAIVVGIVIMLLASADSIFASIFSGIKEKINIDSMWNLIIQFIVIIIVYFLALSLIISLQKKDEETTNEIIKQNPKDKFTIKMLLVVLNIVYLVFCYIQITSLFIKSNLAGTFNYAEYARTGFFQLMFVSFINFVIILISNKNNETRDKLIKILNSFLIVFTIIIVISSMFRMYMYETAYGLTYLRIFVYIILATELIIFIPTAIYVYNSKFDLLKWGGAIGLFVYVIINFTNLENIIINRNLNRSSNIDIDYDYICNIATSDSYDKLDELQNKLLQKAGISLKDIKDLKDETNISACKSAIKAMETKVKILENSKVNYWQEFNISKYKTIKKYDDTSTEISNINADISKLNSLIRKFNKTKSIGKTDFKYNEMINDNEGYLVYELEHVVGDAIWQIEKTMDGGENYTIIQKIDVKTPSQIEFFENGLGFLMIPDTIYCAQSDLYITTNSGRTFTKLEFPEGEFSLSDSEGKKWRECYDYFFLPKKEEDGSFTVLVSGGYEGGYNGGKTRAKYMSIDNGRTWNFVSEVYK